VTTVDPSETEFTGSTFRELAWKMSTRSSAYTAGLVILRFGGFLLIPIYWRYLDPADYGILAVASVVTGFLAVFLGLAVSESVTRFYHSWPAVERPANLGTLWVLDWGSSLLVGVPLALWGAPLVQWAGAGVPFDPYLRLAVIAATLLSLATSPSTVLRVEERPAGYVAIAATSFTIRTSVAIYLVVFRHMGPLGVLWSDVVSGAAMVPVYIALMLRRARPAWKQSVVAEGLRYSMPLVPAVFIESAMAVTDRAVLAKFVTLEQLGLYAVGDSLAGVVRIVNTGLKTAWLPFQMRAAVQRADATRVIGRMATLFVAALLWLGVCVAALGGDVVAVINVPKYFPVAPLLPLFVVPQLIMSLLPIATGGIGIAKRTEFSIVLAIVQLIVGVGALFLLVPRYGIVGAIAAMMVAGAARLVVGTWAAQRFFPVAFEWRKLAAIAGLALATWAVTRTIAVAPSWPGLAARSAAVAVGIALTAAIILPRMRRKSR
jgi:O-antigen/teichoic acid export membrane protein